MITNKSKPSTIDEYITGFNPPVRAKLEEMRAAIRQAAPQAAETINYQIPTFTLNGNLVHFAAFKNHIGFIPPLPELKRLKKNCPPMKVQRVPYNFPWTNPSRSA